LIGCNSSYVLQDNFIPKKEQQEIKPLADSIHSCFVNRNYDFIKKIVQSDLADVFKNTDTLFSSLYFTDQSLPEPYDQYLVKSNASSNIGRVGGRDYAFYFRPFDGYTYIYLMRLQGLDKRSVWLVNCVFNEAHANNKWGLSSIYLNCLTYDNKSVVDDYEMAKDKFEKQNYLEAYYIMHLSYSKLSSSEAPYHPLKEQEIKDFAQKTLSAIQDKKLLPFTMNEINTHPKITNVGTNVRGTKLYTILNCESTLNLSDTAAIKKEGYEISKYINNYIPEISTTTDSIIYEFSNQTNNLGYSSKYSFVAPSK
jgi:hypothetical protein